MIDELFIHEDKIFLIEVKVKDDHDSTKKVGQFINFVNKYKAIKEIYGDNYKIVPVMWFLDDFFKKNYKYYLKSINEMNNEYNCNASLCYGVQIFQIYNCLNINIWNEIIEYLTKYRLGLRTKSYSNFDKLTKNEFNNIKDIQYNIFYKFLTNKNVIDEILPILSPKGIFIKKLFEFFKTHENKKYNKLCEYFGD
jgi:hypothetical protein